jgi:predicted metallopeptidase
VLFVHHSKFDVTFSLNTVKIIKLVWMAVDNTSAKVKVQNILSEPFKFSAGMKRVGPSTALCNIALHSIIDKIV